MGLLLGCAIAPEHMQKSNMCMKNKGEEIVLMAKNLNSRHLSL
jgi:hypothetical protein